jgi:mannose-6-phosphate isomerase
MNEIHGTIHSALRASQDAVTWLRDAAWPLWLEHGVDWTYRGFHESLSLNTLRSPSNFRRLRVAARQVFVFAEAYSAGLTRAAEAVELGMAFLRDRAREPDGGYACRLDLHGEIIDRKRDLYDHAFVMLALASASRVLPAEPLRQEALHLLRYLDTHFPHLQGGYIESLPPALPRRQNPHMHLLEAFLAAWEAFDENIFLDRAGDMVQLLLTRFYDPASGTLPEFFDDTLAPVQKQGYHLVEPGHHCEWVWLVDWYCRASQVQNEPLQAELARIAQRLLTFVDRHGVHPQLHTVYDEVWSNGHLKSGGSRLWPQTERLKSEVLRPDAAVDMVLRAYGALQPYLDAPTRGLWFERLDTQGIMSMEPAPASSLYHLTTGILVAHQHLTGSVRPSPRA